MNLIITLLWYMYLLSGHLLRLKRKRFLPVALKMEVVYKRTLTRGSKNSDMIGNFWYFEKLVTEERWWFMRGG